MVRSEGAWLLLLASVFLCGNLVTGSRMPVVHMDEVSYADPAVRCVMGLGFTSSAWPEQSREEFWAGNVPLHAFLLVPWIKAFGVNPLSVRSLNFVLHLLAVLCLWTACKRLGLVKSGAHRIAMAVLMLCGYGVAFSYRSGRPDGVTVLLASLCFLTFAAKGANRRRGLLFVLGTLVPWAGLQMIPYLVLVTAVAWTTVPERRKLAMEAVCLYSGVAAGAVGLAALYAHKSVLGAFWASTVGQHSFAADRGGGPTFLRLRYLLGGLKDPSAVALAAGSLFLVVVDWRKDRLVWRSPLCFGLGLCLVLPASLFFLGKFPVYYAWMIYLPLCVGLFARLSEGWTALSGPVKAGIAVLLCSAAAVGFPSIVGGTLLCRWEQRDYRRVERFVERHVSPGDWVYCDYGAYYAARRTAGEVLLPRYLKRIGPLERERVAVALVEPAHARHATQSLGENWAPLGDRLTSGVSKLPGLSYALFLREYELEAYGRGDSR